MLLLSLLSNNSNPIAPYCGIFWQRILSLYVANNMYAYTEIQVFQQYVSNYIQDMSPKRSKGCINHMSCALRIIPRW